MSGSAGLVVAAVLFLVSASGLSQESSGPKLCVAVLQGAGGGGISGPVSRDTLIKWLAKQKKSQLTTVSLERSLPEQALAEAKEKGCEYVVTTDLVEDHTTSSYSQGMSATNMPTFFVTVTYQLSKVSDNSSLGSGSLKAQDSSSPQNAVGFTLNRIAGKVSAALKDAK